MTLTVFPVLTPVPHSLAFPLATFAVNVISADPLFTLPILASYALAELAVTSNSVSCLLVPFCTDTVYFAAVKLAVGH